MKYYLLIMSLVVIIFCFILLFSVKASASGYEFQCGLHPGPAPLGCQWVCVAGEWQVACPNR